MDRGAWWAAVHGVARSRTRLSDFTFTFHFHALVKEMEKWSLGLWEIFQEQPLCDPIDGSLPGPAVPGILQARTLEWVAISSSNT